MKKLMYHLILLLCVPLAPAQLLTGLNSSAGNDPDYDSTRLANEVAQAVAMHSQMVRIFARPSGIENRPGTFNWGKLDAIVAVYSAANIQIVINIDSSSPTWMNSSENSYAVPDGANLLTDPGFETPGMKGWTQSAGNGSISQDLAAPDTTAGITSVYDALVTSGSSANTYVSQTVAVVPGQLYHLMFTTHGDYTNAGRYEVYDNTHSAALIALTSTGYTGTVSAGEFSLYRNVSTYFTPPSGCMSVTLYFYGPTTSGGFARFDNAFIIPTLTSTFTTYVSNYASFTTMLVTRYQSEVNRWEVGNEVEQWDFWAPIPDPKEYAAWYTAIHDAIKAVQPTAQVANAPFSGNVFASSSTQITASNATTYGPTNGFLAMFYSLVAPSKWPDAVSTHLYTSGGDPSIATPFEPNWADLASLRSAMIAYQPNTPVWITEFGWGSQGGSATPANQASYTAFAFESLKTTYPYVSLATAWMSYDLPAVGVFEHYGYSSMSGDTLTAKPVSIILEDFVNGCLGGSIACGKSLNGRSLH